MPDANASTRLYEPLTYVDRASTECEIASGDERRIVRALLAASFEDAEPSWVLDQCFTLADDPRPDVRSAVAHAIGHLAIPGDFLDERAREVLRRLDTDPAVRPAVRDATDDIEQFLALRRRGSI